MVACLQLVLDGEWRMQTNAAEECKLRREECLRLLVHLLCQSHGSGGMVIGHLQLHQIGACKWACR